MGSAPFTSFSPWLFAHDALHGNQRRQQECMDAQPGFAPLRARRGLKRQNRAAAAFKPPCTPGPAPETAFFPSP